MAMGDQPYQVTGPPWVGAGKSSDAKNVRWAPYVPERILTRDSSRGLLIASGIFMRRVPGSTRQTLFRRLSSLAQAVQQDFRSAVPDC